MGWEYYGFREMVWDIIWIDGVGWDRILWLWDWVQMVQNGMWMGWDEIKRIRVGLSWDEIMQILGVGLGRDNTVIRIENVGLGEITWFGWYRIDRMGWNEMVRIIRFGSGQDKIIRIPVGFRWGEIIWIVGFGWSWDEML